MANPNLGIVQGSVSRSEGLPERDIPSLCVMGWGVEDVWEFFRRRLPREICPLKAGVFWLTFSSPLGPRIEISAQLRREITRTGVTHLLCFDKISEFLWKIYISMKNRHFLEISCFPRKHSKNVRPSNRAFGQIGRFTIPLTRLQYE